MKKALMVVAVMILSSNAFAKSAKRAQHRQKGPVTTIDGSGPSEPESPWPEITKKGHL
jgi:hypothetical protein